VVFSLSTLWSAAFAGYIRFTDWLWSAATCRRFGFDFEHPPKKSGDKSPHSKKERGIMSSSQLLRYLYFLLASSLSLVSTQSESPRIEVRYSTLFGGSAVDDCDAIAIHPSGAIYLGCHSNSPDIPGSDSSGYKIHGDLDAFVIKINPDGRSVAYRTQIGGADWEGAMSIAVDRRGNAYVVGGTFSENLPVTRGAAQRLYGRGEGDAFISRIDSSGKVVYLTYLGGSAADDASGVAVDEHGNAYIAGRTASADFPCSRGALQSSLRGSGDAFVAKIDPSGRIVYSTLLGGQGFEAAWSVALDPQGNAYVAGQTQSSDFPVVHAIQATNGGEADGFVAMLDSSGQTLLFASYLGGNGWDGINAITLDNSLQIYVTGRTRSPNFPVTPGAFQTRTGGDEDAFAAKLQARGNGLVFATFIGGSGKESGAQIVGDNSGKALVVGGTESKDFPTARPLQSSIKGTLDGFVTWLDDSGKRIVCSTYFGGSDRDLIEDAALGPRGELAVTGLTGSVDYPVFGSLARPYAGGWRDILLTVFATRN
jgi:Beta-propeller repeat